MYKFIFYGDNSYISPRSNLFIIYQNDIIIKMDAILKVIEKENGFNNIIGVTFNKDERVYYEVEIYNEKDGEIFSDDPYNDTPICEFRRI